MSPGWERKNNEVWKKSGTCLQCAGPTATVIRPGKAAVAAKMHVFSGPWVLVATLLLWSVSTAAWDDYHCGHNNAVKRLSYAVAYMCDPGTLSSTCCHRHDSCYGQAPARIFWALRKQCDDEFSSCVNQLYYARGWYGCGLTVHATHTLALSVRRSFAWLFGY